MCASARSRHHRVRDLLRIPLFQGLASQDLDTLAHSVHSHSLAADKPLLQLGHQSEEVYFLLQGTVKVSIPKVHGECILNICGPGAVLGEISAIDEAGHSANVTTLERCSLLWMHRHSFLQHIDTAPQSSRRLLRQMAGRLRHNCRHAHAISQASVSTRVACLLMEFVRLYENISALEERPGQQTGQPAGKSNGSIALPLALPQGDLAATIGVTRQSVNEALKQFKADGWVAVEKNQRIVILDRRALEAYCKG